MGPKCPRSRRDLNHDYMVVIIGARPRRARMDVILKGYSINEAVRSRE